MRERVKIQILKNLLQEITKKYDEFIQEREKLYRQTFDRAIHDTLTGLYNRQYLLDYLLRIREKAIRQNERLELIFMDLDNFKYINDTFGHRKGDEVLREVARILSEHFRQYDMVVRYGGDEFVALLEAASPNVSVERRLDGLRKNIEKAFEPYGLSISYGIALCPEDTTDCNELINIADERMYENKRKRRTNSR